MVCKACQVQLVLLETKDLQEAMETTENQVNKDLVAHLVWTAMWDLQGFQELLAREDPKERKVNGAL